MLVTVMVAAAGLNVSEVTPGCDVDPPVPVLPPVLPPSIVGPVPPVPVVGGSAFGLNPQPGRAANAIAASANGTAQKRSNRGADPEATEYCGWCVRLGIRAPFGAHTIPERQPDDQFRFECIEARNGSDWPKMIATRQQCKDAAGVGGQGLSP